MTPDKQMPKAPADVIENIEAQFRERIELHDGGVKFGKKQAEKEVEFFVGAMSALEALGYELPVKWTIYLMSGRRIIEK